jgi:LacI family transcriptional regulator
MRHPKRWQDVAELLDAGINVYTTLNVQHLDSVNDLVERITGVQVRETLPDAVFAANDMMALGCLFAFNESGLGVPGQIALAGFDDIPMARFVSPPLTTMRVSIAELGERAARALLAQLSGQSVSAQGTSAPELIVRASSAASSRGLDGPT